jgi:hypothetical protein
MEVAFLRAKIAVAAGSPRDESVRWRNVSRANIKPAQPTSLRTKLRLGRPAYAQSYGSEGHSECLTRSLPLFSASRLNPIYVARIPAAPFASRQLAL